MTNQEILDRLEIIKSRSLELDNEIVFDDPSTWNVEESDALERERYELVKELTRRKDNE